MNFFCCYSSSQNDITKDKQVSYLSTETAISSDKSNEFLEIIRRINNLPCFQEKDTLFFVLSDSCAVLATTAQSIRLCDQTANDLLGKSMSTVLPEMAIQSIKSSFDGDSFQWSLKRKNTNVAAHVIHTSSYYVLCMDMIQKDEIMKTSHLYKGALQIVPWGMQNRVCYLLSEYIPKQNKVFRAAIDKLNDQVRQTEDENCFYLLCRKNPLRKTFEVVAVTEKSYQFFGKNYADAVLGKDLSELAILSFEAIEKCNGKRLQSRWCIESPEKLTIKETFLSLLPFTPPPLSQGTPNPDYFIVTVQIPQETSLKKEQLEKLEDEMATLSLLPNQIEEERVEKKRNNDD